MSGLLSLSGTKAANDLKVNVVNTSNINLNAQVPKVNFPKQHKKHQRNTRPMSKLSNQQPERFRSITRKQTHTLIFPLLIPAHKHPKILPN